MRRLFLAHIVLAVAAGNVLAESPEVQLSYRPQPGRDSITETVDDAVTTMRVIEDRGIVAKSGGRLSTRRSSYQIKTLQSVRYITGNLQPDQSFSLEMLYIDKSTFIRAPDGQEHLLPEETPLKGLQVSATIKHGGIVEDGSVVVSGAEPARAEAMRKLMTAILAQASAIKPLTLVQNRMVPQEMAMQLPIPPLAVLDVRMRISNQLLGVEGGVARIQQIYGMDFGIPAGAIKMTAEGSGGGVLHYEVASQTLLSSETGMLMRMVLDTSDGVVEMELNSKQSQKTRPTATSVR